MPFCTTCRGHYFSPDAHQCPPMWRCWNLTNDENPETDPGVLIYARAGQTAAERYVEGIEVADGDQYDIAVRCDDGPIERWRVTAELVLTFASETIVDDDANTEDLAPPPCEDCGGEVDSEGWCTTPGCTTKEPRPAVDAPAGGEHRDDDSAREPVEPLVGMPRYRSLDVVRVDGERPGGVIARFLVLGTWHEVHLPADRFDGEPCECLDDLERMVIAELWEVDGVRPEAMSLRPLVAS